MQIVHIDILTYIHVHTYMYARMHTRTSASLFAENAASWVPRVLPSDIKRLGWVSSDDRVRLICRSFLQSSCFVRDTAKSRTVRSGPLLVTAAGWYLSAWST